MLKYGVRKFIDGVYNPEYGKRQRKANAQYSKAYQARWNAANRDKRRIYEKRWRATKTPSELRKIWRENYRRWAKGHPEVRDQASRRRVLWAHGLTLESYERLLRKQRHRCAICRARHIEAPMRRLHVDHNHKTGQVRGLLCNKCNHLLGNSQESVEVLRKAAQYLQQHLLSAEVREP
ncbi:hypothetical protein LCGC14_0878740 [marine sediment metagenome]|uniref:Recombination endonuclease VII n=1 Tax=marine sediment metagenome TaxID=412755 RepID=A0A0F9P7E7_9ZZZZ